MIYRPNDVAKHTEHYRINNIFEKLKHSSDRTERNYDEKLND